MSTAKVLVVAPSRKTRGGITAVVNLHERHPYWNAWGCRWIETHIDRNWTYKLMYFFRAWYSYLLRVRNCSIVHIHFSEPVSAIRKTFFLIPALWYGKKIILHFHSFSPETTTRGKFRDLYRWMFRRAHLVLVLSERWKREVQDISTGLPVSVLFNPAIPYDGRPIRQPMVLFAGTLNARKGYADLIRAFALVAAGRPAWKLVLAGNGETENAKALSGRLGIPDRVEIPGWIEGETKSRLFQAASVFCLPSYAEGFPMAVVDAMAQGVPVISTPVGGITDVFRDDHDLLLVEPGNIDGLAGKLDMLMRDADMRERIGNAARLKVEHCFHINSIGQQLDKIYSSLLQEDQNILEP